MEREDPIQISFSTKKSNSAPHLNIFSLFSMAACNSRGYQMFNKKNQSLSNQSRETADSLEKQVAKPASMPRPAPSNPVPAGNSSSAFPLRPSGANTMEENKQGSRLHVGKDIHLKGEITACDRLIVEGTVEASMDSKEIEISESGIFEGEVTIDRAEISGRFNGTLTARKKLVIHKTGIVSGTIRYGEIEIEPGGCISGQLEQQAKTKTETISA